jgi:hypothetical protein
MIPQVQYHNFRESLLRVGVADGGIPDIPVGLFSAPRSTYPVPGEAGAACAVTSVASIDCGPLAHWNM